MKYGESTFDVVYLLFAVTLGICILRKRKDAVGNLMGSAVLILGCGDAFHLIPRVLNYFAAGNFTAPLGVGKLVTSVTMTVFYLLLYFLWLRAYGVREDKNLSRAIYVLTALRVILCLFPQNRWLENEGSVSWGVIRNVPFVILGAVIVCLYFKKRAEKPALRNVWLFVTLSFLFYIPVAVGASLVPMLGMLMLPKTICYMLLIWAFWKYAGESN